MQQEREVGGGQQLAVPPRLTSEDEDQSGSEETEAGTQDDFLDLSMNVP